MKKLSIKNHSMSEQDKKIKEMGDEGQGDRLVNRKKQSVKIWYDIYKYHIFRIISSQNRCNK